MKAKAEKVSACIKYNPYHEPDIHSYTDQRIKFLEFVIPLSRRPYSWNLCSGVILLSLGFPSCLSNLYPHAYICTHCNTHVLLYTVSIFPKNCIERPPITKIDDDSKPYSLPTFEPKNTFSL